MILFRFQLIMVRGDLYSHHSQMDTMPKCDMLAKPRNRSVIPTNPNGSTNAIAGLSNKNGNVFAMMPHPERAYLSQQVPRSLNTPWKEDSAFGPWHPLFKSLKEHVEG